MKKIIAVFTVICILFLAGCQKSEPQSDDGADTPTTQQTVKLTFPEGYSIVQIAQKLEENGVCTAQEFIDCAADIESLSEKYSFIKGIDTKNRPFPLEGYVFPDTYDFYVGEGASSALNRFTSNFENRFTDEYVNRAKQLGFTIDEVVNLASIIQKEAGESAEMTKVSSVLHNRLKNPDYPSLQCDASITYLERYVKNSKYLKGDTKKYDELYNSYKCAGLPEGAICNPGSAAIKAALYPEETNYLYFVTDSEGNYYYASTYKEHQDNCLKCGIQG